jgi:TatD DNase family protein
MSWIDVHTHINMLEDQPEQVLDLAQKSQVERLITIGTGHDDHQMVVDLIDNYAPVVWGTLGFHPHDAETYDEDGEAFMKKNLSHPRIVAVGEIGLDFYYDNSPRETQKEVFRKQMELAADFKLPVEIHTRDAEPETIEVLKEYQGRVKGLLHCFTGTQWLADEALKLGYNISISGVVTFKNAEALRETVKTIPLDRIHVETDAPFLTPVPFRGKKNTPAYVVHTAEKVAELKGVSLDELAKATKENALNLFSKLEW